MFRNCVIGVREILILKERSTLAKASDQKTDEMERISNWTNVKTTHNDAHERQDVRPEILQSASPDQVGSQLLRKASETTSR